MAIVYENFKNIISDIKKICNDNNRDFNDIKLVAVSKTVEIEKIKDAINAGARILGENKVQEAESKFEEINNFAVLKGIKKN
ncbi:MAG: YggS family pyridoxal phosphate-dependent enzyme, partial [Elusimicrobiota bacterium]|nr:YggS family pyridoxal phosphate-dependent enzyme [Elusimicrobiota bacterium]